ncbi:hypothetical protein M951_chr2167 (nucleomorph) [Lotharella oceanica]|uniref:Uncharacterized protein n=1 Tax=Lotharella oceanica TaxID=641309 RepID=A0A060DBJ2_9EUKA|nr:hypothetical protein M951_chr2167 [Lotharella oceanica]
MNLKVRVLKSKINYKKKILFFSSTCINKKIIKIIYKIIYLIEPFFITIKIYQSKYIKKALKIHDNNIESKKYKNYKNNWFYFYFINIVIEKTYIYLIFNNNKFKHNYHLINKYI